MANDEHLDVRPCSELELPTRAPFMGPPAGYFGAPIETVELFVGPIREWADNG
ncbi:hypothetical protein OH799_25480 [Nocardia sp. NBC_00881]|uniref:hypothetical protein n=1 Tax=Nocardia sp. NBC_00881 TaxID=2975995 RepID=UPI003865A13E|nr:hypothetical protein OH799_25480 [Nocardia sp. NBC_00881]